MRFFRALTVLLLIVDLSFGLTPQDKKESFLQKLLRVFGISATSAKQKGGNDAKPGEIWVVDLVKNERLLVKGDDDIGYRSPIFMPCDQMILVLKGDQIIKVSLKGETQQTYSPIAGVVKIIGYSLDDKDKILVLKANPDKHLLLGFFSLANNRIAEEIQLDEKNDRDRTIKEYLEGGTRIYSDTTLYVETDGEKSDVFLARPDRSPEQITQCSVQCGQPSLSPEGRYVVYIKAEK